MVYLIRLLFHCGPDDDIYPLSYRPLGKLETLLPVETEGRGFFHISGIRPFLDLPNLRTVYSTLAVCEDGPLDCWIFDGDVADLLDTRGYIESIKKLDPVVPAQLRHIELYDAVLNLLGAKRFFSGCHGPEFLRYVHNPRGSGDLKAGIGGGWDVGGIVREIASIVGSTLKELYVRTRYDALDIQSPIEDFLAFHALERLEVDVGILVDKDGRRAPQSLANTLPPTIRNVTLHLKEEHTINKVGSLVIGLYKARGDRLRDLEQVLLRHYVNGIAEYRDEPQPRRKPAQYKKARSLAEKEGVQWVDEELNPCTEEWGGWVGEYRERFEVESDRRAYFVTQTRRWRRERSLSIEFPPYDASPDVNP